MKNYLLEGLPAAVTVAGRPFTIFTDWRDWVRFASMLSDRDLTQEELIEGMLAWYSGDVPGDISAAVQALAWFYRAGDGNKEGGGSGKTGAVRRKAGVQTRGAPPCFDYAFDAPYLFAAFQECYGVDLLRVPYLHWWEFRWLFNGLPEDCALMKRIAIRATDLNQIKLKEERARIRKQQRAIAIPQRLTDGEIGAVFAL